MRSVVVVGSYEVVKCTKVGCEALLNPCSYSGVYVGKCRKSFSS